MIFLCVFRYDLPHYGSRRKLISPVGMYDEYGELIVEDDPGYYYSPNESEAEVVTRVVSVSVGESVCCSGWVTPYTIQICIELV